MYSFSCALLVLLFTFVHSSPNEVGTCAPITSQSPSKLSASEECKTKSYTFFMHEEIWSTAQSSCKSNGLTFASIKTQQEQNIFVNRRAELGLLSGEIWVSGYDITNNNNFKWVTDHTPFDYTNWAKDYPKIGLNQPCVFASNDSTWMNDVCTPKRIYACQECL